MITVYSRQSCPNCDKVKTWLTNAAVHFNVKDIDEDDDARKEAMSSGLRSLPIIRYGEDEESFESGYNPQDLMHIVMVEVG